MTQVERDRFLEEVLDVLSDPAIAMSEGRPHKKAKSRALDMLSRATVATSEVELFS